MTAQLSLVPEPIVTSVGKMPKSGVLPEGCVYIGRGRGGVDPRDAPLTADGLSGAFGNPWRVTPSDGCAERDLALMRYRAYLDDRLRDDAAFREAVRGLRGKTLLCFCVSGWDTSKPLGTPRCHGQILALRSLDTQQAFA